MSSVLPKISIVTPVYNEEKNLSELCVRLVFALTELGHPYEIIFVNDGSSDRSAEIIKTLANVYTEVVGIDLAGNYGQTIALRAGIEQASGAIIILMDSDLQHDPADIPLFIHEIEKGYEVVGGKKLDRPEKGWRKWISEKAHQVISSIAGVQLSYFGATYKAYKSYLLKSTNLLTDNHRFLGALVVRKGVRYTEIPIRIHPRLHGVSNYSMNKIGKVVLDMIYLKFFISFLTKPFRLLGTVGLFLFGTGCLLTFWLVLGNFIFQFHIKENYFIEFIFGVSLILSGLLFLSIGIVTQLSVQHYFHQKNHSPYIVRSILQHSDNEKDSISCR
ncbi:MAG: glycosyltransferase family 2 protein [Cytophagaceae bacterium]|jgi:glycosyltransferase involved in cell wall biosynthesis|nr:glycosyltransferase family 2 protein [Cytophagaceae bacterium]